MKEAVILNAVVLISNQGKQSIPEIAESYNPSSVLWDYPSVSARLEMLETSHQEGVQESLETAPFNAKEWPACHLAEACLDCLCL